MRKMLSSALALLVLSLATGCAGRVPGQTDAAYSSPLDRYRPGGGSGGDGAGGGAM